MCMCPRFSAVGKIPDCQPGPGFNLRPSRGLNFGKPQSRFSTPSVVGEVMLLV